MDTLENLARLIRRRRDTQGECCHLLITQHTDNSVAGYKALAELLRAGYFSTVVTVNPDDRLERALHEIGLFPPNYRVFMCGHEPDHGYEPDEKVAIALDGQEKGICIIKLPILQIGACAGDIWKSLIDYLKENIVILGSINGMHDDLVQALIAERKSSLYYIVSAEYNDDRLLTHMRQRQLINFLICGHNGILANFFNELTGQLLQKDSLISQYDTITDVGQHDSSEGRATDAFSVGEFLSPMTDQFLAEDEESKTEPLSAIAPDREKAAEPIMAAPGWEPWSVSLEDEATGAGLPDEQSIKSGPLVLGSPQDAAKNAIRRLPWPDTVDMLIVTATRVELKAFLDLYPQRVRRPVGEKTYYDLGYVGRVRTVVVQANNTGPIEAVTTTDEGIRTLSPRATLMVGIAFGLLPAEQRIGDVLVSMFIHDYDPERVGTGADDQPLSYPRGTRVKASDWLIDRFRAGSYEWPVQHEIHVGPILSGSKLIDNKDYQETLLRAVPDAIGGEMEGVGFSTSAMRHKVDWLLVKGISDWADGTKKVNKAENQRLAAENAAKFALFVIEQEGFMRRP